MVLQRTLGRRVCDAYGEGTRVVTVPSFSRGVEEAIRDCEGGLYARHANDVQGVIRRRLGALAYLNVTLAVGVVQRGVFIYAISHGEAQRR